MEHGSSSFSFATQRKVAAGCRVCEGTLFTPKIKENRYCYQSARKKIACGAQCGYSFLIGGGAARLAETRPLTEERVVRPPPCVRVPTCRTCTRAQDRCLLPSPGLAFHIGRPEGSSSSPQPHASAEAPPQPLCVMARAVIRGAVVDVVHAARGLRATARCKPEEWS